MPLIIGASRVETHNINGKPFRFIIECLKQHFIYLCTIDEVISVLKVVPADDMDGLDLFVFRQPENGNETRECCWGAYDEEYPHGGRPRPAIVLDAIPENAQMTTVKQADRAAEQEMECLREDGHTVAEINGRYVIASSREAIRKTQLYRTVYHLISHHIEAFRGIREEMDKEKRANRYARELKKKWLSDMLNYD